MSTVRTEQPGESARFAEAEVVAALAERAAVPHNTEGVRVPYLVVPEGHRVEALDKLLESPLDEPARIRASVDFVCSESFVAYVSAFRDAGRTRLFANAQAAEVTAYLDYHAPDAPSRATHSAKLKLKYSRQWSTWFGNHKKSLGQVTFAEFLEDNVLDIVHPDSATVIEAAKHLEAKKNVAFTSGINLRDGAIQFKYEEEIESRGKGDIEVPDGFIIAVSPFDRGLLVQVPVKLRFRINDQKLSFTYVMQQPEKIVEDAFDAVVNGIEQELDIRPLFGAVTFK